MQGSDLWWHLAIGERILEGQAIPRTDPYSFTTTGRSWLIDSWLSDVAIAAWSRAGGMESLVYWKWLMLAASALVLLGVGARLCRMWEDATAPTVGAASVDSWWPLSTAPAAWLAVWLALASAEAFLDVRPQLFSLLCFAAICGLTLLPRRWSWATIPFFVVWANLHAGYVIGLIVLVFVGALRWGLGPRDERRRLLWVGVGSVVACLATPYGPETMVRPLRYAFDTSSPFRGIGEWLPPFAPGGIRSNVYPFALTAALGAVAVLMVRMRGRWRSPTLWGAIGITLITLIMSLRSRRFVPFFSLAEVLVVAPALSLLMRDALIRLHGDRTGRRATVVRGTAARAVRIVALVLPLVALLAGMPRLLRYPLDSEAFLHLTALDGFPIDTFDFIEANGLEGNLFNYYNWGGYATMRTGGTLQTYIDGRAGTVYSDDTFRAYQRVLGGQGEGWIPVVENTDAAYFLWPIRRTQWSTLVDTHRWRIIHQDAVSTLLARNDRVPERAWKAPPDGPYRFLAVGALLAASNRLEEAETVLERAYLAMPNMGRAGFELATTQFRRGHIEEARATMRAIHEHFPHEGRAEAWKANTGMDP